MSSRQVTSLTNPTVKAVRALHSLDLRTCAAGDSYNDIHMLKEADVATFFRAPANIRQEFPEYGNLQAYAELKEFRINEPVVPKPKPKPPEATPKNED